MNCFSTFTGIGLHDLGLQWAGMNIIGQCERNAFCLTTIKRHWPDVPKWRDIRNVKRESILRRCGLLPDLITGGFPCQEISIAVSGARNGIGTKKRPTKKSGLFWQLHRVISECRPRWICLENVPNLRVEGSDRVLAALEGTGYACWPLLVQAFHVGAPIERERVWIVGLKTDGVKIPEDIVGQMLASPDSNAAIGPYVPFGPSQVGQQMGVAEGKRVNVAERQAWQPSQASRQRWPKGQGKSQHEWEPSRIELGMGRMPHGGTARMVRQALGNANPPQVPEMIGRAIMRVNELLG